MNEFFLIAITLLCSLIRGNDRAPALVYALVAHMLYIASLLSNNVASLFMLGAVSDLIVVVLLVCLSGCLRSRIVYCLIPLSGLSAFMHAVGYGLAMKEADFTFFNSLVVFYMCVILALFAFSAGGYGNIRWNNRLLNRDISDRKNMAMVSK